MQPKKGKGTLSKIIAILLTGAMAAMTVLYAATACSIESDWNYYHNGALVNYIYEQELDLRDYVFLQTNRDILTQRGRAQLNKLERSFAHDMTNLRFQVMESSSGLVVAGEELPKDQAVEVEMSFFGRWMGCSKLLSAWIDVSESDEWDLVCGNSSSYQSQIEYASDYYYETQTILDAMNENLSTSQIDEIPEARAVEDDYETASEYDEPAAVEVIDESDWGYTEASSVPVWKVSELPKADRYMVDVTGGEIEGDIIWYYIYEPDLKGIDTHYYVSIWYDHDLPVSDAVSDIIQETTNTQYAYHNYFRPNLLMAVLFAFLTLCSFGWLCSLSGWKKDGTRGLDAVSRLPIEIPLGVGFLTVLFILTTAPYMDISWAVVNQQDYQIDGMRAVVIAAPILLAGCFGWYILLSQLKEKKLIERSILLSYAGKAVKKLGSVVKTCMKLLMGLLMQWKLYYRVAVAGLVFLLIYLVMIAAFVQPTEVDMMLCILPLLLVLALLCYWAVEWHKVRAFLKTLTEGRLEETFEEKLYLPDMKDMQGDLNRLSEGLSHAVDERVKSQRFRTELITNVSHDLKTPLTSIINYVDLLKKLELQDDTARRYIDVLDRKSQRLKTLTEDLVEASKAASGTIGVQLTELDLCELMEQAVGEYEERLRQAALKPVVKFGTTKAMAVCDGRHVWRILDNLLSNCTKYALPGTRVYLDLSDCGTVWELSVKNISADPLNVPAEELLMRFVRGDSARSTEGSGLGLSIARNLTLAQGGEFDLVVDGDLFKTVVRLPKA